MEMNIEDAIEILKNSKKLYLKEKIDSDILEEAIGTLLTAYEKPYNQILDKKEMSKEEAEKIIDDMYHDKTKVYGEGNVVHVDLIGTVKFTNLEFASVRLLREVVSLENDIDKIKKLLKELEDYNYKGNFDDVDFVQDITERFKKVLEE